MPAHTSSRPPHLVALARLIAGLPTGVAGLSALPHPWGVLARKLEAVPLEQRADQFRSICARVPNGHRLANAIFAIDPRTGDGPSPVTHSPSPTTWEPPVPITERAVPLFPVDTLPPWLRDFVRAEAAATQTPPDLAGCLALAALATAAGGRFEVHPWDDWLEPVNLYLMVVLPPGAGKSPVFASALRPIQEWDEEAGRQAAPAVAQAEDLRRVAEQALHRARDAAARANDADRPERLAEVARLSGELQAMRVPARPRLIADDCSPERLATLMQENGGRIAVLSPEGGVFDMLAGRYSSGGMPNLDHFLKGHAGDPIRVDRVGRAAEYVRRPALTVGLSVQPDVLRGLIDRPGFEGRGLLARFLYSVPVSLVGRRADDPVPMPAAIRAAYHSALVRLLAIDEPVDSARALTLSPPAAARLRQFRRELEPRLSEFGDLARVVEWGSKLVGHIARLAGLLHLACYYELPWPAINQVEPATVEAAIELGAYFTEHARAAFDAMGRDPAIDDAHHLLKWFVRNDCRQFTRRELYRMTRGRFRRVDDLNPALDLLERHGYLRRELDGPRNRTGRPPGPRFDVSPFAFPAAEASPASGRDAGSFGRFGHFVQGGPPVPPPT